MTRRQSLFKRLRSAAAILIPLILSSMDRIETISNAMSLRGFGKNKKRTWYMGRRFTGWDFAAMALCLALLLAALPAALGEAEAPTQVRRLRLGSSVYTIEVDASFGYGAVTDQDIADAIRRALAEKPVGADILKERRGTAVATGKMDSIGG